MIDDEIGKLNIVLRLLTWKNEFLLSIFLCLLLVLSFFLYENFEKNKLSLISRDVKLLTISAESEKKIKKFNDNTDNIVVIQVVTLSLKKNIRVETYTHIKNNVLHELDDKFIIEKMYESPIFNANQITNKRMVRIISGEFVCVPAEESPLATYAPTVNRYIKEVCAIGVPPHDGAIDGIITFYASKKLTEFERRNIFLFARELSAEIKKSSYDKN